MSTLINSRVITYQLNLLLLFICFASLLLYFKIQKYVMYKHSYLK
jgi:hypothetical protein